MPEYECVCSFFISKPFEDLIFWFVNRELSITNTNGALFWAPFCFWTPFCYMGTRLSAGLNVLL